MALTGFVPVNESDKQKAAGGFSLSSRNSPFIDKVEFKVEDYLFVRKEEDGVVDPKSRPIAVLKTSVGNLFLSMLTRRKVDSKGAIKEPNGSFNVVVRKCISDNSGKSDGEILTELVKLCKGKKLVVKRTAFVTTGKYGDYATDLIEINFK